ncbi:1-aminocyclopropane-1-carboxylate oxidase homolog 1-like [Camellia sinensis]|uniref:1-aminocyclopropane-1-carboxylate oxidase homolog 1-like n=1 Tax=Camellia sinensis TaxID=4442 RepID=UPI0010364F52|nr:1-aminocyclopropane-1-carboxylate oxidase homolog 1-like [Camellia sinensis]
MTTKPEVAPDSREATCKESDYDRAKEVKEFDETKAGVKGLLDAGVVKVPRIFIHPPESLEKGLSDNSGVLQVPVIDLSGFRSHPRGEIVREIRKASETWGFFQMVNHGIPDGVMEEMIEGIKQFHEQPMEVKMEWYSRDAKKRVRFYCNGDLLVAKTANWRDSIVCIYDDGVLDSDTLPIVCRKAISNYMEGLIRLKETLSKLLSQALGLSSDYLTDLDCMKTASLVCHYYPFCPEPDLTLGASKHSDPSFLTILLQDHIGGLQVFHQNNWVNVVPMKGALIANIGDLMQLITNDKFKSVEHRVLAGRVGPRISAACFFYPSMASKSRLYGPIEEFLSQNNPPIYRKTHHNEYQAYYKSKGLEGTSALLHYKLE